MATLSEVHYLLPDRGKVVGTDRIIINQNSTTTDATLKVSTLLAETDSRAQAKADAALKAAKADACDKADAALAKAKAADPVYQKVALGNYMNYVYSRGQTDDTLTVLSAKMWIYQHGDRNQFLRFKQWGAANDTEQTYYSQVMLPNAWTGGNGLLRYDIYTRLDNFELREQNSTATEVVMVTPIFTAGGTRTCSLSAATSAKAGVMTAADKTLLSALGRYLHPDTDNLTTLDDLNAALDAMNPDTAVTNTDTTAKAGNALAGAAKGGASLPFPANIAAIAAGVAAVVAVIAMIGSLAFEQGGIVPGTSLTGDRVTARVNSGEMIINRRQQLNLWRLANTRITPPHTATPATLTPATRITPAAIAQLTQPRRLDIAVTGRIAGRDIKLTLDKRNTLLARS